MAGTEPREQKESVNATKLAPISKDLLTAFLVGLGALAVMLRTLAPDLLYGDSSEFQTLAYTLGVAHPTGYPIYTFIAWLTGHLPIGSLPWRINFLSALAAACTVAGVFLLACYVTRRRLAAVLASFALLMSYSFWGMAVIAEVYTMGTLCMVVVMLALWHWGQRPAERKAWLFAAALTCGLSLGVHLFAVLIAPAALLYVLLILREQNEWRQLIIGVAGTVLGVSLFVIAYLAIDARQDITGYDYVTQYPSGTAWGIAPEEVQTPWLRLHKSLLSTQWQGAMFTGGLMGMAKSFAIYGYWLLVFEFGLVSLIAMAIGWWVIFFEDRTIALFLVVGFTTAIALVIIYEPGDKNMFYLPSYILLMVAASAGFGWILDRAESHRKAGTPLVKYGVPLLLVVLIGQHLWPSRLIALADGRASFIAENYPYPVDLNEPRARAQAIADALPDDALVLMEWRYLYAIYFIVAVEQRRTGIRLVESTPYRTELQVQPPLLAMMDEALANGRPVFTDKPYNLHNKYNLEQERSDLYRVTLRTAGN